jgi:hypothetical protein
MAFKKGKKNASANGEKTIRNIKPGNVTKKASRLAYRDGLRKQKSDRETQTEILKENITILLTTPSSTAVHTRNGTRSVTPTVEDTGPNKRPRNDEKILEMRLLNREKQERGLFYCTEEAVRVYCYVAYIKRFNEPAETEWGPIASILAKEISVDVRTVKLVFKNVQTGEREPWKQAPGKGRYRKLGPENNGLLAGALALNTGVSPEMATAICNETNQFEPKVCRKTFLETLADYTDVETKATPRRKTGSKDDTSDWAVARAVIAEQMSEQFRLGNDIDKGTIARVDCQFTPLHDDAILYADENHVQQTIGGNGHTSSFSSRQYFVSMDPCNGRLKKKKNGGKVPARRYRVVPKYPKESRGCYAVAAPIIDGKRRGKFMKPFNYTLKTLVSYKVWKQAVSAEITKRRRTKGKSSTWYKYKDSENPYLARYGEGWEAKMEVEPGSSLKPLRSCHQLIDHLIEEGKKIWSGTKREHTWMVYHDHLKIFWEAETIEYMKSKKCPIPHDDSEFSRNRTWFDRMIKIEKPNKARVHERYNNKLPGDSPELMPLDCHLFADLKEALARNIAFTFWMEKADKRKYKGGTPNEVYQSICRTIETGGVSEHRIIEDIIRIKNATLDRIVTAKGTYIDDSTGKSCRHGIRGQEFDAEKKIKVDPAVRESFKAMIANVLQSKQSCPIIFDLSTGDDSEVPLVRGPDDSMYFVSMDTDVALEPDGNEEEQNPEE